MAGNFGSGWCGNQLGQLLMTLAMFGTMPQAFTRTSTSFGRGFGHRDGVDRHRLADRVQPRGAHHRH